MVKKLSKKEYKTFPRSKDINIHIRRVLCRGSPMKGKKPITNTRTPQNTLKLSDNHGQGK